MTGMLISRFFSRVERVETCRISKCFTCSTWTKSALRYALLLVVTVVAEGTTISDGMKWYDGRELPIEGRAFDNTEHYYDRLPSNVTTSVNSGVRSGKHNTSGMLFRFSTDSTRLVLKWTPYKSSLSMDHMPAMGVSGIDVYRFDAAKGRWRYVKAGRITSSAGATLSLDWTPGTPCLVNLPLYNGIKTFTLGIDPEASVSPLPPRASGIDKPVVFYGTSITQGGCASRPGMSFVNIVGRDLDVPVVNLGFSGSGLMELEMSEHLAAIDARQPPREEAECADRDGWDVRCLLWRPERQGRLREGAVRTTSRRRVDGSRSSSEGRDVLGRLRGDGGRHPRKQLGHAVACQSIR